jgi:hypothetical protein
VETWSELMTVANLIKSSGGRGYASKVHTICLRKEGTQSVRLVVKSFGQV